MSLTSTPDVLVPTSAEDNELLAAGLPLLYVPCATVTITSKHVLKKAAKLLGVLIHGFTFSTLGDDLTAAVSMDVPPHKEHPFIKSHMFYGDWARFTKEAKESACVAALTYLKDAGLLEVHDTNFDAMNKYKRKFEAEHFWSSMLYERADSLKKQLPGGTAVATEITSHGSSQSTPFASVTGSAHSPSKGTNEGIVSQRQPRRALFLDK